MKKRIFSMVLACLLMTGLVSTAVFAEEDIPGIVLPEDSLENPRAAGVVFTAESGFFANSYTGFLSGVSADTTAGDLISALENSNGIELKRGNAAVAMDDKVKSGDILVLTGDDGAVKTEFTVVFMGDADMSGAVNLTDASAILKVIASWKDVEINESVADVDGNGAINLTDVSTILKKVANWDVEFVRVPVLPGKYDMINEIPVPCYGNNPTAGWLPLCLSDGIHYEAGVKFNVPEKHFAVKLSFLCPSWSDNEGSITVSVYKWTGDYASSVAAMPIVTETIVNYEDNSLVAVDITDASGKGLVEGEYVWRIHDCYDDPEKEATGVGVWYYSEYAPAESTGMKTFLNGKEFNFGPVAVVSYSTVG